MKLTVNPENSEFGRAPLKITPLEFEIIIPHIIKILQSLYEMGNSRFPYYYAFEFDNQFKDTNFIRTIINQAQLSKNVYFYQTDGRNLFELRSNSGGLATGLICYLTTGDGNESTR